MPVYFVLFDAQRRRAYWVNVQTYFRGGRRPAAGVKSIRVHIPSTNRMSLRTVDKMKAEKASIVKVIVET